MNLPASLLHAIENYLAGEASEEEERLVNDWYHSFDDSEVEMPEEVLELRHRVGGRLWRRLTATIARTEDRHRLRIGYRRALVAAASVFILFLAGFLLFRQLSSTTPLASNKPMNDIAPGGNRAILTLADGTHIALDSAQKGMLTQQGTTRILKLDSGKLAYQAAASKNTLEPISYNTITTPRGGQFQVTLPDGTIVWLNAATSLRYPTRFEGHERRVTLTGEAYFEVTKNPSQPFFVDMPDRRPTQDSLHIQVLGTNFNVNAYQDETMIKTTLIEGAVKIMKGRNAHLLSPGQQAQTDITTKIIREADIEEALAWKNGLFQYNSTDLKTIMRQLARWYDVQVIYEGKMKDEFFSGSVPRTGNVSQLLHMLAMTNTVHFTIEGKNIYVAP